MVKGVVVVVLYSNSCATLIRSVVVPHHPVSPDLSISAQFHLPNFSADLTLQVNGSMLGMERREFLWLNCSQKSAIPSGAST